MFTTLLVALLQVAPPRADAPEAAIQLNRLWSATPHEAPVLAAAVANNVVASAHAHQPYVYLSDRQSVRRVWIGDTPVLALGIDDSTVHIARSDIACVEQISLRDGVHGPTRCLRESGKPTAAAYYTGTWYVAVRRGDTTTVAQLPRDGDEITVAVLSGDAISYVTPGISSVIMSRRTDLALIRLDHNGVQVLSPSDIIMPLDKDSEWVSLALLRLDRGYIRTLADLRSNRRQLVLYDADGHAVRITELDNPLGLTAADSDTRQIVAVRRGQIDVYGWRWAQ